MNMNFKRHKIKEAKAQFIEDIKFDKDFIEYKNNCVKNGFYYGCVISSDNKFTINHIGTTNEYIVSRFIKFQNKLLYGKKIK